LANQTKPSENYPSLTIFQTTRF